MSPRPPRARSGVAGLLIWMTGGGSLLHAQVPDTLRYSFFAPKTLPQRFEQQGFAVAASGEIAVVGSPLYDEDDVTGLDCGVVKVYDAGNGNLLHRLSSPTGTPFGYFGQCVAISGSKVVVGSGEAVGGNAYAGRVYVYDFDSPTPAVPVLTLENPDPSEHDQFGHSVAIEGDIVVVGAWLDDAGATDSGRAYVYDLGSPSPPDPVLALDNPSPAESDCFGVSVAVSSSRVAVAAYHDNTGNQRTGRVYIYDLESPVPAAPQTTLGKPGGSANDCFGNALAMAGSLVVVGAELGDADALNSGNAYVFDLDSGTPGQPAHVLSNPVPQAQGYFGTCVSISGNTVAVGAYRNDTVAENAGACYIFDLAASSPGVPAVVLSKPAWDADDYFGNAVSISGTRVVAGAWRDDSGDEDSGISYVYDLGGALPEIPVIALDSPLRDSTDHFGSAVAIEGDLVAVGSPDSDSGATRAGRVSVHDLASSKPAASLASLDNPNPALNDAFGAAVAVSGKRVIAGAPGADVAGSANAGMVYVYDFSSGPPPSPLLAIPNPAPAAGDAFGAAVAISGDLVAVGSALDDGSAVDSGSVHVFDLSSASPGVPVATIANPDPAADARFGCSISLSGNRLAVGAMKDDTGAANAGIAYLYDLGGSQATVPILIFPNPGPASEDAFGEAVAISGNLLAIGAGGDDTSAANAGSVYFYDLNAPAPAVPVLAFANPNPATEDRFGHAVAVSASRLAVGAPLDNSPTDSGRVYCYDTSSPTPTVPVATLVKSTPTNGDQFGASVGISGLNVIAGAPSDNKTALDKGAAYLFGPAAPEIAVEGPGGEELVSGDSADFGPVAIGQGGSGTLSFTILNTGITGLPITGISLVGGDSGDFSISTEGTLATVPADDDTAFTVTLSPTVSGSRTTKVRILNGDANESPFDIVLTGTALSSEEDADGDGLNDVAELRMAPLGFDWQSPDAALVAAFQGNTAAAGLFSADQVQALRLTPPRIVKEPAGGNLKLTWALEKSTDFSHYVPFPMTGTAAAINSSGEFEFRFNVPDNAAFFRLEAK